MHSIFQTNSKAYPKPLRVSNEVISVRTLPRQQVKEIMDIACFDVHRLFKRFVERNLLKISGVNELTYLLVTKGVHSICRKCRFDFPKRFCTCDVENITLGFQAVLSIDKSLIIMFDV